jgi:hypothetical protein
LQFGSAFHEGAEWLLQGQPEEAVLRAFLFLEQALNGGTSFDGETPANVEDALRYGREEQMALVEALLCGWWVHEGPSFLEQFEIVEVEREGRAILARNTVHVDNVAYGGSHPETMELVLMFRPDALVRERASGDLYIISWKTCSTFGKRNVDQARHDMQSMSEMWGVEEVARNDKESQHRQGQQATDELSTVRVPGDGIQNAMLDVATGDEAKRVWLISQEALQGNICPPSGVSDVQWTFEGVAVSGPSLPQSSVRETGSYGDSDTGGELSTRTTDEVHSGTDRGHSTGADQGDAVQSPNEETRNQQASNLGGDARHTTPLKIEGVIYRWIVKGRRSLDKWDGLYKQQTPLIYGWVKRGDTPEMDEWSWSYEWEDENGKSSRLGKGWRRVPIWREYEGGVKAWIDDLHHQRVFPRHLNALDAVFPVQTPVERRVDEVESWRRQVVAQELEVMRRLDLYDNVKDSNETYTTLLDPLFPQHTHSCHSFSGCQFIPICWEGARAEVGELYQIRTANHPEKGDDSD